MNETLIFTVVTLVALGIIAAIILYFVAQKFKVFEDPRIEQTEKMLPGANCGGCGYPGCKGLANALVKEDNIEDLFCPVGGSETMKAIATALGKVAAEKAPMISVVRCGAKCGNLKITNHFDGAKSCIVSASLYGGETGCSYGCLGGGDCVQVCTFGALKIDPITQRPVIDEESCTGCGKCVSVCPKGVMELRPKGIKGRRVYINCMNTDKGAMAKKACDNACIGCGKCVKTCPFGAVTVTNSLAYIDPEKCKLCRKCVVECPTGAIKDVNFPKPMVKVEKPAKPVVKAEVKAERATENRVVAAKPTPCKSEEKCNNSVTAPNVNNTTENNTKSETETTA